MAEGDSSYSEIYKLCDIEQITSRLNLLFYKYKNSTNFIRLFEG